jgi:hypothetical protein
MTVDAAGWSGPSSETGNDLHPQLTRLEQSGASYELHLIVTLSTTRAASVLGRNLASYRLRRGHGVHVLSSGFAGFWALVIRRYRLLAHIRVLPGATQFPVMLGFDEFQQEKDFRRKLVIFIQERGGLPDWHPQHVE